MTRKYLSTTPEDAVIHSTIKVYELLGAEVFLYFDVNGTQMTARVNPGQLSAQGIRLFSPWIWKRFICLTKKPN